MSSVKSVKSFGVFAKMSYICGVKKALNLETFFYKKKSSKLFVI